MAAGDAEEIQRSVGSHENIKTFLDALDNHMQAMVQVDETGAVVNTAWLLREIVRSQETNERILQQIQLLNLRFEEAFRTGINIEDVTNED